MEIRQSYSHEKVQSWCHIGYVIQIYQQTSDPGNDSQPDEQDANAAKVADLVKRA